MFCRPFLLLSPLFSAATPFAKTLVIASMEHLFIQDHQPEMADRRAGTIPESNAECVLAKAEAMSAAAAEWLRAGNFDRANTLFAAAASLAQSAGALPIGQINVLSSISEAEAAGGLAATAQDALHVAKQLALQLPVEPRFIAGAPRARHYRHEAYRHMVAVAISAHDLATARRIANLLSTAGPAGNHDVIRAWLDAGTPNEAIAFARGIQSTSKRAETELDLAQQLLDQAGAPNF